MAKATTKPDWEAIAREYRAGQVSVRAIGNLYGVSHTAIAKKAKAEGWSRDLACEVRSAVNNKLVSKEVANPNANADEIIEAAAARGVAIVENHRKDIAALRDAEAKLIAEIHGNPAKLYLAQYRGNIVEKEVSLTASERASALQALASVQHKRIALERQAYNLDDAERDAKKMIVELD